MVIDPVIRNDARAAPALAAELAATIRRLDRHAELPAAVRAETLRTLLNVVHTAVGAAAHPVVDGIVRTHGATGAVPVLGRTERLDVHAAALAIGAAAHLDDFDDTHLATVIHPGAACLAAGLGVGWQQGSSGLQFERAVALGVEVQLRAGLALTDAHYDAGWHITGTCGVIGAAVTAGLLAELDDAELARAIGLAVSQTVGHREGFGSAAKALNAGKAAANGVLAVLLARAGFTAPDTALEGDRGYFAVLSPRSEPALLLEGLGADWHLLDNTYKPYPCGIVCHPPIDAAINLHPRIAGREVVSANLRCHPLVAELTGNAEPRNGLQARFSTVHGVAAGLLDGEVGLAQYDDARVTAAPIAALRRAVTVQPDERCHRDEATLTVTLADGTRLSEHVAHARGSLARPLTDAELADKGRNLVRPVLGERTDALAAAVRGLPDAPALEALVEAATPGRSGR